MSRSHETLTERLVLNPPCASDLEELHRLHADPAVWQHLPSGRHTSPDQTAALVERYVTGWREHGLDVWVARKRSDTGAGALVGIGGCSLRYGLAWNLYYRLEPHAQGRGYAQEIIAAACSAAAAVREDLPVIAYLLEHNTGSSRAAERAGLRLVWRGPDAGNPDPSAVRLVYSDRQPDPETLAAFTDP